MNHFKFGLKDGIAIGLGYLSVSFAFGIFAVNSGLTVAETVLISMLNLTSAGQLATVPIIAGGGSLLELALSQIVINMRYALMSVSLSQKMGKDMNMGRRMLFAFANTDEIFAVSSTKFFELDHFYLYGLMILPWIGWSLGTLLGAAAGDILPPIISNSLSIAIYGMFIAIVVPAAKAEKPVALCALLAATFSLIMHYVPFFKSISSGFVIMICAVLASFIMALLFPIEQKKEASNE